MISAKLLDSNASLNDYFYLNAVNFVPGENVTVALQVFDAQSGTRYIPPSAATMTLTFTDKTGTNFNKTATVIDADDRSMWSVVLSQAETTTLAGQNVIVTLDVNGDSSVIQKTLISNGIIRTNLSGDC